MGTAIVGVEVSFRNGKRTMRTLREQRPIKMKSQILYAGIGFVVLIVIAFATKPTPVESTTLPAAIIATTTPEQKQDALDVYLSRLAWTYECVGACFKAERNKEPFRIVDSNKQYSYGCLQFQQDTYIAMAKKYHVDAWAGRGIYDCDNQWKIARAMFEENKVAAAQHWYTSIYTRGLGLPNI